MPFTLYAQQPHTFVPDSLKKELLVQKTDTNKEKLLHRLAYEYVHINADTARDYGKQELALAKQLNFKKGIAAAFYIIGVSYSIQGDFPNAMENINMALKVFKEINDQKGVRSCYSSTGIIYSDQDNYPEALKNFYLALASNEKSGDTLFAATCYCNIGIVYSHQKKYDDAALNYNKALNIAANAQQKKMQGAILQDIADMLIAEHKYDDAFKNAMAALNIAAEINDKYEAATVHNVIAGIYSAVGKYAEAIREDSISVRMLDAFGANLNLANALGGLGNIFLEQKKYTQAKQYFEKELSVAKKTGSMGEIADAEQNLSAADDSMGNYKEALDAYRTYITARDSINNEAVEKKTLQAKMQYDFDKKEFTAKEERDKKLHQKNMVISGILVAFTVFVLISILLVRQGKLKARHQALELEQKQLRAQMNPHFIFNCLNSIQHFVVANDHRNAHKYLMGFALLMRQTLENSKSGAITIRKELEYLENYLSLEWMLFEDKFTYNISCAEDIDVDREEIPAMIIQPFIENAIRHGLCCLDSRRGLLKVSFYLKEGYVFCEVDDNGIGREEAQKLKKANELARESHGIELSRQRLTLIGKASGADYHIEIKDKKSPQNEPEGTTVIIKFPTYDNCRYY